MACSPYSHLVLLIHLKLQPTIDSLSLNTCPLVLQCSLDNLFNQQNKTSSLCTDSKKHCQLKFRICDLESILHSLISKSILTVIEYLASSSSEQATDLPASLVMELFQQINTVHVISSDESNSEESD